MTTKHKPQPADKWLATVKDSRRAFGRVRRDSGPYAYATDGALLLATGQPGSPLPNNDIAHFVTANRAAAITGTVTGLRAAVRPLKQFAADTDRVTIRVNGRLDVSAESPYSGDARGYIDGADYTHSGPDAEIGVSYRYLAQALDGLPETVTFRIHRMKHGPCLGLAAIVDGAQREALIAGLEERR